MVVMVAAAALGIVAPTQAIEVHPTSEQIRAAVDRGKEAAREHRSPDEFYVRFGSVDELQPGGFVITKVANLSVLATHMALRGVEPSHSDIAQVTETPAMLVTAVIFGERPSFAVDSYLVLEQRGKTVSPVMVRVDGRGKRSASWPNQPRFQAKIVAWFNYADFDPAANTTITIFPAQGGQVSFTLDFAQVE